MTLDLLEHWISTLPSLTIYLIVCTSVLAVQCVVTLRNTLVFSNVLEATPVQFPKVSILVPARNEERCIEQCIRSLCTQDYPNFEVIVCDDGSTDSTPQILARLQAELPMLSILRGLELPINWKGKPFACHQLSRIAKGELLLFTDADTTHEPLMLPSVVNHLLKNKLDLLSVVPFQRLGTLGEKLTVPLVHFLLLSYIPHDLERHLRSAVFTAANGQFMLFRSTAYFQINGHESVKECVVEDVELAKHAKRNGQRVRLARAVHLVSCRMYTSFSEAIRGFSKNFFAAMHYSLGTMILFIAQFTFLFLFPVAVIIVNVFLSDRVTGIETMLALASVSIGIVSRLVVALFFGLPLITAALHVPSIVVAIIIGINAIRWHYFVRGGTWKGRDLR